MRWPRLPLRLTIPVSLLLFAGAASLLQGLADWRQSERALTAAARAHLAGQAYRLQGTIEHLLRRGDRERAEAELAALGAEPEIVVALLIDEAGRVMASTRRADRGRSAQEVLAAPGSHHGPDRARRLEAARMSRTGSVMACSPTLEAVYPVLLGAAEGEIRPSRVGLLFLEADLTGQRATARRETERRVASNATALALLAVLGWVYLHFTVSRRATRLVAGTERFAAGDLEVRLNFEGRDELARVAAAFDRMAEAVGRDQVRLREDQAALESNLATLERNQKLEAQLREVRKLEAVGRLAGGIAHEYNNLLTAILGYADLLLTRLREPPETVRKLEEIKRAGLRAASLTHQLLAFSRRQLLMPQVLDLGRLVKELARVIRNLIGEQIEVEVSLPAKPVQVRADRGQLEHVLLTLALNAQDAMPQGGRLAFEVSGLASDPELPARHPNLPVGPWARLTVTDTGVGMDQEVRSHLFEPFFTTKEVGQGTGLGLAAVLGIVEQSGGAVEAESQPGRGSSFRVYLPAVEAELPVLMPVNHHVGHGTESILLVEDEAAVRRMVRDILEERGYRVLDAASGEEALRLVNERPVDLLLTDLVMPGMGGRELARHLCQRQPTLKVVFMSGYDQGGPLGGGPKEAGVFFVEKPFAPANLARTLREALDS